jgi:sigma-B regulation protein RsbU (phosphoserine phosphatase)
MFFSIKFKILISIAFIMTVTAGANIYFTHRDVGRAMLLSQREASEKMVSYVRLNTEDKYRSLLRAKMDMTLEKRGALKNTALVAVSVLDSLDRLEGKAGTTAAETWIKTIPSKDIHYLLLDRNTRVIAASTPRFRSDTILSLTDVKGRDLAQAMTWDRISDRGDYAVVKLGANRILTYFVPFSAWQCTLATVLDIDDIEAEAADKLVEIIKALESTARELVMIKGGYSFMFTGEKEFVVSSSKDVEEKLAGGINTRTDRLILDDMMAAATRSRKNGGGIQNQGGEQKFIHVSSLDPDRKEMVSSISYFKPLDWYIGVTTPVEEIRRPARELVVHQNLLTAVMLALGLLVVGFMVSRIASPLKTLAAYAKKLPDQDFTAESSTGIAIKKRVLLSRDEVGELARSFEFMETELKGNISNLMEITAARERIQGELNVAREIQMGIIPKTFPTFPDQEQFDLFATIEPAKEVGGDLYDFFLMDEDHLCLTLGDVSDKGVPAALFMVITRTLIKTTAEHERSPAKIMSHINNILEADNPRSMFVTLIIGVLNIRTGVLTYASGGHNHPILIRKNGETSYKTDKSGPMVGVIGGFDYRELSVSLLPGDSFFLYTDGVTEAMDPDQQLFSDEQLLGTVENGPLDSLEKTVENVMVKVKEHAGTAPQSDDIAMLKIRYNG